MADLLALATTVLTLALVGITFWYAWQTQQMVREMAQARSAAVRPALRLDFGLLPEESVFLVLENVGVGPALQVSVVLEIKGFTTSYEPDRLDLPLVRPGERFDFLYPTWGGAELMSLENVASVPVSIVMTGNCIDVSGRQHSVHDELSFADAMNRVPRL